MTTTEHDWRAAGAAWGSHADDWACLVEHYAIDAMVAVFGRLGIAPSVRVVDIACGSGLGVRLLDGMGATVSALDASEELVSIARLRAPSADVRVGSMFELPSADATFDAAVSINGIWGGCEAALEEAFRVLRPGAPLGITFWGAGEPLDIRDAFRVFAWHAPDAHRGSMRRLNDIAVPGVAEAMLESAGFTVVERADRTSVMEWPNADLAWRALSSSGPAQPALRANDPAVVRAAVLEHRRGTSHDHLQRHPTTPSS